MGEGPLALLDACKAPCHPDRHDPPDRLFGCRQRRVPRSPKPPFSSVLFLR